MKNLIKNIKSNAKSTLFTLSMITLPYFSYSQENIEINAKDTINVDNDAFIEEIIDAKLLKNGNTYVSLYVEDKDNDDEYDYIKIRNLSKYLNIVENEEFYINKKDIVYMDNLEKYSFKTKSIIGLDQVFPILNQNYNKKEEMPEKLKRIINNGKIIQFTSKNLEEFLRQEYERNKIFEY